VRVTDTLTGCTALLLDTARVTVLPVPTAPSLSGGGFCVGDSLVLDAGPGHTAYRWFRGGNPLPVDSGRTYTLHATGTFSVEVTNAEGCRALSGDILVTAHPLPDTLLPVISDTVYTGENAEIQVRNSLSGVSYQLLLGEIPLGTPRTGNGADLFLPVPATALNTGLNVTFWVQAAYDSTGCAATLAGTASVLVLQPVADTVFVPNIFTPNADGLNDEFRIDLGFTPARFELQIYTRWGELVYTGRDAARGWDGRTQGEPAPAGVYFYRLRLETRAGTPHERTGSVTLLR
jgi:gliding motility-associated-like protein